MAESQKFYYIDVIWANDLQGNPPFEPSPWKESAVFSLDVLAISTQHFLGINGNADTEAKVTSRTYRVQAGYERKDGSIVPFSWENGIDQVVGLIKEDKNAKQNAADFAKVNVQLVIELVQDDLGFFGNLRGRS